MKFVMIAGMTVLLAACGSTVPLNDVAVADASPKAVVGASDANQVVGGQGVTPVNIGANSANASVPSEAKVIYFDYDSFVIKSEFQSVLAAHAKVLKGQSTRKVAIEGHADEMGGREYNLALGQKRADSVRSAMSLLGVSEAQMESISFGEEKPAVLGSTEQAYAKNRRAEIRYP